MCRTGNLLNEAKSHKFLKPDLVSALQNAETGWLTVSGKQKENMKTTYT